MKKVVCQYHFKHSLSLQWHTDELGQTTLQSTQIVTVCNHFTTFPPVTYDLPTVMWLMLSTSMSTGFILPVSMCFQTNRDQRLFLFSYTFKPGWRLALKCCRPKCSRNCSCRYLDHQNSSVFSLRSVFQGCFHGQ